jgi:hypothetical protein
MGNNKLDFVVGCADFFMAGALFVLAVTNFAPPFTPVNIIAMALMLYVGYGRLNKWKDSQ